ncbi:unnamed protein product [Mytilus coruscus]|uniref:Uncharacterized protein n=1 Tax=Mytilus coruscus TaxID=42192 RepID=A0A6J8CMY0_MYTCO|nr:unnamed protein product [Mytilus coruscus]
MGDSLTQQISMALYRYSCQNIVGSEDHVKTIRLMNTVRDNLLRNNIATTITSGSFGEGLDMKGSDLDIMQVFKVFEVYEDVKPRLNASLTYFSMKTDNVKPGFTQLLLKYTCWQFILIYVKKLTVNIIVRVHYLKKISCLVNQLKLHGPCISDDDGLFDNAFCFHCKSWISTAEQWITRSTYAYFLKFLCHYHLNNVRQCQDSLDDLKRVIVNHFFVADHDENAMSYNLFGIALQLSGDTEFARQAFLHSVEILPFHEYNPAFKRFFQTAECNNIVFR